MVAPSEAFKSEKIKDFYDIFKLSIVAVFKFLALCHWINEISIQHQQILYRSKKLNHITVIRQE